MLQDVLVNLIRRYLRGIKTGSSAIVDAYDPTTHRAKVRLMPDGEITGYLPVLSSHVGYADTIQPGTPCHVFMEYSSEEGVSHPVAVAGVHHNDSTPPPEAALSLGNDVHVQGNVVLYGGSMTLGNVGALPTPTPAMRGQLAYIAPTMDAIAGTADKLYIVLQSASGSLSWVLVATG